MEKAAKQGYAPAQADLGYMYLHGFGVKEDNQRAVRWIKKAAEQGDVSAQGELSRMYEIGDGVRKDEKKAREWAKGTERKEIRQGYVPIRKKGLFY